MSSPPSLEPLKIATPPATSTSPPTRVTPTNQRPPSPSPSPPETHPDLPESQRSQTSQTPNNIPNNDLPVPRPEDTPPPTPGTEKHPGPDADGDRTPALEAPTNGKPPASFPRPQPPASIVSAPAVPNVRSPPTRGMPPGPGQGPGPNMGGRGGMPMPMGMRAPMGMGMRGNAPPMQSRIPASLQAKMDKIAASRPAQPTPQMGPGGPNPNATSMSALLRSQALGGGQAAQGPNAGPLGLAARRGGPGALPRPTLGAMGVSSPAGLNRPGAPTMASRRGPPGGLTLSGMKGAPPKTEDNKFTDFGKIMDPSGSLRFSKKAVLHSKGVDFEDGKSFKINMDEIEVVGELGRGNYGSVQQVFHRPTGVYMAMKEIRLELDESKLNGIIMELDILHRAKAPEIVEFYGAFTIESCVYYCMELMDAGSLDTLTGGGKPAKAGEADDNDEGAEERVPEAVLRRITAGIVKGLKFLKDELQIMHRDVKPTNVLINKKGEVKLCDFGVSGQLEKSLAKTNIGCQSYMAPERIKGESQNQLATYTVSSDVWSVGLSIIELAKGCYPYPPETFANVFAQLTAIVHGPAPTLPKGYSADAHDFVAKCLLKDPNARPTYAQLLQHPFLVADVGAEVDMAGWVSQVLERRQSKGVTPLATVEA